ncbi:MAG: GntP family permease [Thermanaeromonas sp.]|uniref:GntP family permease n=1 Tax=Thermanaeromonas sp. TaxID=2003697 RepID=UPI0024385FBD|nr:GntP family permease [Thermanaeromonas sp.]MCG0277969.1 GntP family permease [Thermanaeromonas sp.]
MPGASGMQMIVGLVIGVIVLVFLILRTKIHAFPALIIAASLTGLIGGMPPAVGDVNVAKSITTGFGNTLASIGIVIGFGVMMGRLLEVSGAAERMAYTFLKYLGRGKEEWALAATGYVVSIPIFCDSGFVILSPLAKALSSKTKKSILTLGVALAMGLVATHHAIPPTPGPLAVAGIFKVDVGKMILAGLVFALPVTIAGVLYARWLGKKIYQLPSEDGTGWVRLKYEPSTITSISLADRPDLPSAFMSFAPIVVPVILIIFNTVLSALKLNQTWAQYLIFLGNPVIAVGIGLIIAIYGLAPKLSRPEVIKRMEEGVASAGIIILVTGAGGALGQVLRDSGAGNYIAKLIASTPMPPVLLPFIVATIVRLVQGSGTVAMITSASITAPILAGLPVNPLIAAQAAALGAMVYSYFNDSYFWVVNRLLGVEDVKEQTLTWSIPTTIGWLVSLVLILIADAIL